MGADCIEVAAEAGLKVAVSPRVATKCDTDDEFNINACGKDDTSTEGRL